MKYFKKMDYLSFGVYIAALFWSVHLDYMYTFFLTFAAFHLFPLTYLLRKHGYLSMKDDLGLEQTDKMDIMINELIVYPIKEFLANRKLISTLIHVFVLSVIVFVLSHYLYPKLLGIPFLAGSY